MIKIILTIICVVLLVGCNKEILKESEVISIDEIMTIYENGSLYVDGRPTGYVCYEEEIEEENKSLYFSNETIGDILLRRADEKLSVEYTPPDYSKTGYNRIINVGSTTRFIFLECLNSTLKINDTMLYCEPQK